MQPSWVPHLCVSVHTHITGEETGFGVALGKGAWGAWLLWACNLILWHTDFRKRAVGLMMFTWMASRIFHCLRMRKLIFYEQNEAARLAWCLSCAFGSVVMYEPGYTLQKYTSEHPAESTTWMTLCYSTAPFSLPALKLSIPQLHRRHKENPTLEKFIVWKNSNHSCLVKTAACSFKNQGLDG